MGLFRRLLRGPLLLVATAAVTLGTVSISAAEAPTASAALNDIACAGAPAAYVAAFDASDGTVDGKVSYPERRIWLENQSWWEPQESNPAWWPNGHPAAGGLGHIHVGFCTPLGQSLAGATARFNINLKLHQTTGIAVYLNIEAYGDAGVEVPRPLYGDGPDQGFSCSVANCERNVSYDFPLSNLRYSGWHYFYTPLKVFNNAFTADGGQIIQYNVNRWQFFADNGKPAPPVGSTAHNVSLDNQNVGGDSWYLNEGSWTKYARSGMPRTSIPWDESSGVLTPISGTWTPTVSFQGESRFVYIDPDLHNPNPALRKGIVVLEDTTERNTTTSLSINTTQLSNGVHYLLIGNTPTNVDPRRRNTGVLKVPFLVQNNGC